MEFSLEHLQPKERASFALRSLYETAGCRKYHMGRFEEYSLYQENRSFLSSEQVITFTDLDGRLLALKPDVTLSIAKTAQPAPGETLRYYYHENVYRPSAESHTFKEISQMGLELLGAVGEAEVQQAVCLAAQSLAALGAEWVLEVSHMGYLFGLFDALNVPEAARAQLLEKLRQKNAHELRAAALAAGLGETAADALCGVLELSGSYAATLSKAAALCRNPAMTAAVAELTALAPTLGQAGGSIRLDLTLAGEMEYYNGLVFQGYLKALPRPLLKGGRYDLLLQKFTPGAGAIGFAVYLDELDRLNAMPPVQHQDTGKVMLNVALPKGRLGDKVYNLLAGIGYGCPEDYNATRKLVVENPAAGIRYFLVKPSDVAIYVEHGAADIGIGMGITGTDVTKNVADMVLADDNFATIVGAVEEGRRIYDNIQRAIKFLLGSNMSEVLSIFTATMLGFMILEPVHLLWINLVTDCFPALALGMEEAEPAIMRRRPRDAKAGIFAGGMGVDVAYQGLVISALTIAAFFIGHFMESGVWEIPANGLSPDGTTMAFVTMSMAEIFHSLNMRSQRGSILKLRTRNKMMTFAAIGSLLATTLVCEVPFIATAFDFTSVEWNEYLVALALAFCVIPIVELVKFFQRKAEK